MKILIIEDDFLTALNLKTMVEDCGHEVVVLCGTLADAGVRIREGFDFAFLDIDLPDGKSFPIAEELNRSRVPFAFLSGSRQSELPATLQHVPFIPKPYFQATIRNSLEGATALCAQ